MPTIRKQPTERPSKGRFSRLFFIWALFLCVLVGFVSSWGLPAFAEWRAAACERNQQLIFAAEWHRRAESFGANSAEYWLARARIARKLAFDEEQVRYLTHARDKGADRRKLELEVMLSEAQRGQLSKLRSQLSKVLKEGGSGDEIGNAYVEGCLISYRLDEALSMINVWQADFPADGRPHFLRGRILEHRTNMPGAEKEFRIALEKQPKYAAASYNIAQNLVLAQKPEDAIRFFRICARDLGSPVPGLVGESHCLRLLRRYDEAQKFLEKAERADQSLAIHGFRLVGESREAGKTKLIAEQGRLAAETNDHARAVTFLEQALESAPLDWRIRYQLALSQRQVGQLDPARQNLQRVEETKAALASCDRLFDLLRKDPGNIPARLHIGKIFLQYLSENQGLVWLNSVLDSDPNNGEAHRLLAEYFENRLNEHPESAEQARMHRSRATRAPIDSLPSGEEK